MVTEFEWTHALCAKVETMREVRELCDAKVVGNDGQSSWAHSCVLASASPLLRRMLVGKRAPYSIYIDGISGHIWQFALHFLYVGEMCALNEFEALAVAAAGEKLGINAMVMAAKQYFTYTDNHGIVNRDNISSSPTQNRVFSRADRNELPGKRRLDGAIGPSQYSESQGKKCRVGHFSGDNVGSINNSASTENVILYKSSCSSGNRDETPLEIQTFTKESSSDLHHKKYLLGLTSSSDGLSEVVKACQKTECCTQDQTSRWRFAYVN
ncbi:hypothetical protein LSAT2_031846 [Lamellibrachia satsuma]|nr:hypothetical protein LSAT2_031846 [Lamellibrachia satsuma]